LTLPLQAPLSFELHTLHGGALFAEAYSQVLSSSGQLIGAARGSEAYSVTAYDSLEAVYFTLPVEQSPEDTVAGFASTIRAQLDSLDFGSSAVQTPAAVQERRSEQPQQESRSEQSQAAQYRRKGGGRGDRTDSSDSLTSFSDGRQARSYENNHVVETVHLNIMGLDSLAWAFCVIIPERVYEALN